MTRAVVRLAMASVVAALVAACGPGSDDPEPTDTTSALPFKTPPIPGLTAGGLAAAAQAALPDAEQRDDEDRPSGYRPETTSVRAVPGPDDALSGSTPGIRWVWNGEDNVVLYVSCADVDAEPASDVIETCIELEIPGVPAGALGSIWKRGTAAGAESVRERIGPVEVVVFPFTAKVNATGPAHLISISGDADARDGSVTSAAP